MTHISDLIEDSIPIDFIGIFLGALSLAFTISFRSKLNISIGLNVIPKSISELPGTTPFLKSSLNAELICD